MNPHRIKFEAPIWRIEPSPDARSVCIETRNAQLNTVNYFIYSLETGRLREWLGVLPSGAILVAYISGRLIFSQFKDSQRPEAAGLWIFSNENIAADFFDETAINPKITAKGIVFYVKGTQRFYDFETNKIIDVLPAFSPPNYVYQTSEVYFAKDLDYAPFADKLNALIVENWPIEVLTWVNGLAVSYYTKNNNIIVNESMIIINGITIFREQLLENVLAPGLATFCKIDKFILFIKNKIEFLIYNINENAELN